MPAAISSVASLSSSATTSLSFAATTVGPDAALLVFIGDQTNITGVTFNGVSLGGIGQQQNATNPFPTVSTYYSAAPALGTFNVVATNSFTENMAVTALSMTGATGTPSTGSGSVSRTTGNSTGPSVAQVGSSAGGLFLSAACWVNSSGAATVNNAGGSSLTQQSQMAMSAVSTATAAGPSISGTQTLAWTLPTAQQWSIVTVYVAPAPNVTLALTGQGLTASRGSVTPVSGTTTVPLSGHNLTVTASTVGSASPFPLGMNLHFGPENTTDRTKMVNEFVARKLTMARFDVNFDNNGVSFIQANIDALRAAIPGFRAEGIILTLQHYTSTITTDYAQAETDAYNQAYPVIEALRTRITTWELLNETQLHPAIVGQIGEPWTNYSTPTGATTRWTGSTGAMMMRAVIKGCMRAVRDVGAAYNINMRVMCCVMSRDFAWLKFLGEGGVTYDVVNFHYYPYIAEAGPIADQWYTNYTFAGGPFDQLVQFGKPLSINEFNGGEVYDVAFENVEGGSLTETSYRSIVKHMDLMRSQTVAVVEAVIGYEFVDRPWLTGVSESEKKFGYMWNYDNAKVSMLLMSAYAGGTLSGAERTKITSRTGLLTGTQIDNIAASATRLTAVVSGPTNVTLALTGQQLTAAANPSLQVSITNPVVALTGLGLTARANALGYAITPSLGTTSTTVTTTGGGSHVIPTGVTSVLVEAWGAGGGGGTRTGTAADAGGGGGAYVRTTIAVAAGQTLFWNVPTGGAAGVAGGAAWLNYQTNSQSGAELNAVGGGAALATTTGGVGGLSINSTGTTGFSGADGGAAQTGTTGSRAGSGGGGGAGSGGNATVGGVGSSNVIGTGGAGGITSAVQGIPAGGAGGAGGNGGLGAAAGVVGTAPGGGGGGGGNSSGVAGAGARGQIRYTYDGPTEAGNRTIGLIGAPLGVAGGTLGVTITSSGTSVLLTGQGSTSAHGSISGGQTVVGRSVTTSAGALAPARPLTGLGTTSSGGLIVETTDKALTGLGSTSAAGTVTGDPTRILVGQALTSTAGPFTSAIAGATLVGQETLGTGGLIVETTTVALTGQAATSARGTLGLSTPDVTTGLFGQGLTSATGSLAHSRTRALTGQAATSAVGNTLGRARDIPLAGLSATALDTSTVVFSPVAALVGLTATSAAGALAILADGFTALTGQALTSAHGSLGLTRTRALTGQAATSAQGTVAPTAAQQAALTGLVTVATGGTLGAQSSSQATLTGQALSTSVGVVGSTATVTVALAGQALASTAGAITVVPSPNRSAGLIGAALLASRGNVQPLGRVTGVQLLSRIGRLGVVNPAVQANSSWGTEAYGESGYFAPASTSGGTSDQNVETGAGGNPPVTALTGALQTLSVSVPLVGSAATVSRGTFPAVINGRFAALSGSQSTATVGALRPVITPALLGQSAATQRGLVSFEIGLTGLQMTAASNPNVVFAPFETSFFYLDNTGAMVAEHGAFPAGVFIARTPDGGVLQLELGQPRVRILYDADYLRPDRTVVQPVTEDSVIVPIEQPAVVIVPE